MWPLPKLHPNVINPLKCTSKSLSSYPTHDIYKGIIAFQSTKHSFTTKLPKLCYFMSRILTDIEHEKNLIIILTIYVTHSYQNVLHVHSVPSFFSVPSIHSPTWCTGFFFKAHANSVGCFACPGGKNTFAGLLLAPVYLHLHTCKLNMPSLMISYFISSFDMISASQLF